MQFVHALHMAQVFPREAAFYQFGFKSLARPSLVQAALNIRTALNACTPSPAPGNAL